MNLLKWFIHVYKKKEKKKKNDWLVSMSCEKSGQAAQEFFN